MSSETQSPAQWAQPQGTNCPRCHVPLAMFERQSVEIDYCPQCRGVWLDRGELDKILERTAQPPTPSPAPAQPAPIVQQAPPMQQVYAQPQPYMQPVVVQPDYYHNQHRGFLHDLFGFGHIDVHHGGHHGGHHD